MRICFANNNNNNNNNIKYFIMMIHDDDNDNNNNYFIIITCIIIYTIVLASYIFWKKKINKKHDSEFFRSMCTRIEIITTMIFLLKNRQPTYAIPTYNQHKTILLKNNKFGLISVWLRIRSVI